MFSLALILSSIIPAAIIVPAAWKGFTAAMGSEYPTTAAALLYQRFKRKWPDRFTAKPSAENLAYAFGWVPDTLFMVMGQLRLIAAGKDPNYWPSTSEIVSKISKYFDDRIDNKILTNFVTLTRSEFLMNDNPGSFDYLWITRKIRSNKEKLVIAAAVGGSAYLGYQIYKAVQNRKQIKAGGSEE